MIYVFFPATDSKAFVAAFTMIIGALACAVYASVVILGRIRKIKKGYETEAVSVMACKLVFVCAVILYISYLLGRDKGIPVIVILLSIIIFCYSYFTRRTGPGHYLYAMGGNEKAAKLSGVNTDRVFFGAYLNVGFLAAIAALVVCARLNSASPSTGTNYEMDAIASCYIGGASAYGGTGTVSGTVIGAIFMGVLNNGMSILGIDANWQKAVKGFVLLAAVVFDIVSKNRKSKK